VSERGREEARHGPRKGKLEREEAVGGEQLEKEKRETGKSNVKSGKNFKEEEKPRP